MKASHELSYVAAAFTSHFLSNEAIKVDVDAQLILVFLMSRRHAWINRR